LRGPQSLAEDSRSRAHIINPAHVARKLTARRAHRAQSLAMPVSNSEGIRGIGRTTRESPLFQAFFVDASAAASMPLPAAPAAEGATTGNST